MKIPFVFLMVVTCWVVLTQSCFKMRISDSDAKKEFANKGLSLEIKTEVINHFKLH
jgi:hypothetical protein